MHFRDRGRSIQLVRTTYDAQAKKPASEVLGSLQRPKLELTEEAREKLTSEELVEVTSYIEHLNRSAAIDREHAVIHFKATIEAISAWLVLAEDDAAAAFIEEVQKPLSKLRRDMVKRAISEESSTEAAKPVAE